MYTTNIHQNTHAYAYILYICLSVKKVDRKVNETDRLGATPLPDVPLWEAALTLRPI